MRGSAPTLSDMALPRDAYGRRQATGADPRQRHCRKQSRYQMDRTGLRSVPT